MSREAVWALHFGRTDGSAAAGALTGGDGAAILHTALTPSLGRGVRRFESGGGRGGSPFSWEPGASSGVTPAP